jgi:hypothetical protein
MPLGYREAEQTRKKLVLGVAVAVAAVEPRGDVPLFNTLDGITNSTTRSVSIFCTALCSLSALGSERLW